jgi:hypothetical protein
MIDNIIFYHTRIGQRSAQIELANIKLHIYIC